MRAWFSKLNQMSLRNRLIIAVILCVFLPWITTYFVSNYVTKDILEQRAVKQSTNSLNMIDMNVKTIMDDVMYTSNYIQFDTEFNRILKQHQMIDADSTEASKKIALSYIEISKRLEGITNLSSPTYITILFQNQLYYMNYSLSQHNPLDFQNANWFQRLKNSSFYQTQWIGAHPNYIQSESKSNPFLISIARNIGQSSYQDVYLIISIKEEEIRRLLENYEQNSNHHYFLTNQAGEVYSSVNAKEIGTTLDYNVNRESHQIVNYEGEEHFLISYPVSYSDWRLVSLVPYQETIGDINEMTQTTITIQGLLLLLFLIGLIVLVREMTKPMIELNAITKEVEKGELSKRANISGNNDVAKLGHSFNHMLDTIEEMIDQIRIREQDKRTAELEMLQAQINPHFLFNVLNAIRLQIKLKGDKDSSELIHALSSLLRMTINRNNPFITLEEELEIIEHYTRLMNFRHQHEVELEIILQEGAKKVEVPRFFLQPIIENGIIHGYHNNRGTMVISGDIHNGYLKLQVTDDGAGMTSQTLTKLNEKIFSQATNNQEKSSHSFNGIGIQNVYQRLQLIYGDRFSMELDSEEQVGTDYTFYIPMHRE